jgi:exodeoxyribonuclease VII small subunit
MTARSRKEPSFEEAMERLEQIVAEIESEKLGLERQFELFREGMELARFCERKLTDVEKAVEVVLKETNGEWRTAAFAEDSADAEEAGEER